MAIKWEPFSFGGEVVHERWRSPKLWYTEIPGNYFYMGDSHVCPGSQQTHTLWALFLYSDSTVPCRNSYSCRVIIQYGMASHSPVCTSLASVYNYVHGCHDKKVVKLGRYQDIHPLKFLYAFILSCPELKDSCRSEYTTMYMHCRCHVGGSYLSVTWHPWFAVISEGTPDTCMGTQVLLS